MPSCCTAGHRGFSERRRAAERALEPAGLLRAGRERRAQGALGRHAGVFALPVNAGRPL